MIFNKRHVRNIIILCVASGSIAAFYGLVQYVDLDPLEWLIPSYDKRGIMVSFFGQKNYLSLFLLLMIPMGFSCVNAAKHLTMRFSGLAAVSMMLTALVLSRSRGGFIAYLFSIGLIGFLYVIKHYKNSRLKAWAFVLSFLIPVGIGSIVFILPQKFQKDFAALRQMSEVRMAYYRAAVEVIARHPVGGAGPGSFVNEYPLNETHKTLGHDPNKVLNHVHSDLLEIAVEYGFLGVIVYLSIIWQMVSRLVRRYFSEDNTGKRHILLFFIGALIGYFIYSQFTVAGRYISSTFFFWLTLGICYKLTEDNTNPFQQIEITNPIKTWSWTPVFISLVVTFVFAVGIWTVIRSYRSDVLVKRASMYSSKGMRKSAIRYLNEAEILRPNSVEVYYQRGFEHFQRNDFDKALSDYKKVNELAPNHINLTFNMASCYYRKHDWINAIRFAERSHRLFPDYEPPLFMLANCYYYIRQPQKAIEYCNRLLEKNHSHSKAHRLKRRLIQILGVKS